MRSNGKKWGWQGHVREVPTWRAVAEVAGIQWVESTVIGVFHIRHVDQRVDRTIQHATRDPR